MQLQMLERRANVKFERSGPPSTSTVMAAAAEIVPRRLMQVQPNVQRYFEEAAKELLEGEDVVGGVAKALALVAGKVSLTERSLLTGEDGLTTLLLTSTDGSPLNPGDAMALVSTLGTKGGEHDRPADAVGKIRSCRDPSKVRCCPISHIP